MIHILLWILHMIQQNIGFVTVDVIIWFSKICLYSFLISKMCLYSYSTTSQELVM